MYGLAQIDRPAFSESSDVRVSLVPPEGVEGLWGKVGHLLKKATDMSGGRYRLKDLKAKLISGEFQLWVVYDEGLSMLAAITSTFTEYPQYRVLHGQFLGGDRLEEWRDKFCALFDRWGRDNHCKKVEFTGRAGWAKRLAPCGYREIFRVYEREL